MTILRKERDIAFIREAGSIIREIFLVLEKKIEEGVSTYELDSIAESYIREKGGEPAFKGYRGYPATICASVNDVVVHGIPSRRTVLRDGDIIGVDVGVKKNGFFADAARTYPVGEISPEAADLLSAAGKCLEKGIEQAVEGNRVSDISNAVERTAKERGFQEVRSFVGHGIGRNLHESPEVPNWGEKGKGPVLKKGLLLAIEPMINQGSRNVRVRDDGWTAVTVDGRLSAHFEHTVMIGRDKGEIIT